MSDIRDGLERNRGALMQADHAVCAQLAPRERSPDAAPYAHA